jgi:hypothetical protein
MAKNTKYESALDLFLNTLKTNQERTKANKLRSTWWDKKPNEVNEHQAKINEIAIKRYSYY